MIELRSRPGSKSAIMCTIRGISICPLFAVVLWTLSDSLLQAEIRNQTSSPRAFVQKMSLLPKCLANHRCLELVNAGGKGALLGCCCPSAHRFRRFQSSTGYLWHGEQDLPTWLLCDATVESGVVS